MLYNPGVLEAYGLTNLGLVVRISGRVSYVGADHIYVDDGGDLDDGSGHAGVKVKLPYAPDTGLLNSYAVVTGISGVEKNGADENVRVVLVSGDEDVVGF